MIMLVVYLMLGSGALLPNVLIWQSVLLFRSVIRVRQLREKNTRFYAFQTRWQSNGLLTN